MDFWPPNSKTEYPLAKTGIKTKQANLKGNGHSVFSQGSIGAASIARQDGQLNWGFIARAAQEPRVVAKENNTIIFPPTWQEPSSATSSRIIQRAEQGAHFLRTYFPDIDIASDLIREELEADARNSESLQRFDPFAGNLLTSFPCYERTRKKAVYLAFPMGDRASDLNVSSVQFSRNDTATFVSSATPAQCFSTPIRQLVSSESHASSRYAGYVGVRTYGVTSLFGINTHSQGPDVQDIARVTRSDIGGLPIIDMILNQFPHSDVKLTAVDTGGSIYSVGSDNERTVLYRNTADTYNQGYWRLACATSERAALLLSGSSLRLLDFRTASTSVDILSRLSAGTTLTFSEHMDDAHVIRVASTREMYWLDERYPQRPLLAIKHNRRSDRSLRGHTVSFNNDPITFLTSDKNALVTVYDVSSSDDAFIHLNATPYMINQGTSSTKRRIGRDIVKYPSQSRAMIVELLDNGSIYCTELRSNFNGPPNDTSSTNPIICEWSPAVKKLAERAAVSAPPLGPFGGRSMSEVDFEPPYHRILGMEDSVNSEESQVYENLESMRMFWQELDAPVEHLLTAFDVAFRSGNEPNASSRADFFAENALSSKRGFRALMQKRIPVDQVSKGSAWRHNISPTLRSLVPALGDSPQEAWQTLSRYDLLEDDYRTGASMRRETEAREQIALDLALCEDVFSPHSLQPPQINNDIDEDVETMSRAAEAMTIGIPEPPDVHFGFLRPMKTRGIDHYARELNPEDHQHALGVRLLLQEWEVGEDIREYSYNDLYDSALPVMPAYSRPKARGPGVARAPGATPHAPPAIATAPQPPIIAPSSVLPLFTSPRPPLMTSITTSSQPQDISRIVTGSQPTSFETFSQASQEVSYPSTQIMPGPFGGRPTAPKPKPMKKKRLGGF